MRKLGPKTIAMLAGMLGVAFVVTALGCGRHAATAPAPNSQANQAQSGWQNNGVALPAGSTGATTLQSIASATGNAGHPQSATGTSTGHSLPGSPAPDVSTNSGTAPSVPAAARPNGQPKSQSRRQDTRVGKVVSFTAGALIMAVEEGAADVGTDATYNLTAATKVRKDGSVISTCGQVPNLSSLGLQPGYDVAAVVQNGNITGLAFNSNGSMPQRKRSKG